MKLKVELPVIPSPIIHPCEMRPGQMARILSGYGPLADDPYRRGNDRAAYGDTLLCCEWANGERTVVNLTQPCGLRWDEAGNNVMRVRLLPTNTRVILTQED